ncbi:MAG TPA: hypothetical protein VJT14_04205 [Candidatus Dormibacteraeota bacterium]|nr:hypothetical protein [Candidatus Dormibacteraeota bacterium]
MNATVVSTETPPADRVSTDSSPPDLTYLAGFSTGDVAHNREGRLSPNQRLEALDSVRRHLYGVGALLAFAILTFAASHNLLLFAANAVIAAIGAVHMVNHLTELRRGGLSEVVGDARPEVERDSEGPDCYWLHIGDLKLEVTQAACAAFRSGGPYRLYYLATTGTVVGGEVLADWRPLPTPRNAARHWWQNISISLE